MFDAHCHLDLLADPPRAWAEARAAGVCGALVAGVDPPGWAAQARLAATLPGLHCALGLHPWRTDLAAPALDDVLAALAPRLASAAAVGETGLDRSPGMPPWPRQLRAFRAQLALARTLDRPVVLHVVRAHAEALAVVDGDGLPAAGGMVHGFTGSAELAREWSRRGLMLSLGGPATWTVGARRRRGIAAIPEDALLVETDAPDQPPAAARAARRPGAPAMLGAVVDAVARLRGCAPETTAATTARNARRLLGLPPTG